jgi:hypothetical protein
MRGIDAAQAEGVVTVTSSARCPDLDSTPQVLVTDP